MAATPDGQGYWLVASDGGIFTYGDAEFYGSTGSMPPEQTDRRAWRRPPTAAATGWWPQTAGCSRTATPHSYGYIRRSRRAISTGFMVGIAPDRRWPRATGSSRSDGGIFAFGDAGFYGSMGGTTLNAPMVGMAAL